MTAVTNWPDERADDSGDGLVMFATFTTAALVVTGAVALLALVGSWWMLGVAFGVHVLMTALITFAVMHSIAGRTLEIARPQAEGTRDAPRSTAPTSGAAMAAHR